MPSQSYFLNKVSSLNTFQNPASLPEGSLLTALNLVVDRDNIISKRRVFTQYGATFGVSSDRCSSLFSYKNKLLRHFSSTLQYDNGSGTFTSFTGTYSK